MIFILLATHAAMGDLKPIDLRCDYKTNPIGIDDSQPQLSWVESSPVRGAAQGAYQILVASSPDKLKKNVGDLWDSGRQTGDETAQIAYAGTNLAPGQTAWWKVVVWDQKGGERTSAPAHWELGLSSNADWRAQWISLPGSQTNPLDIPAPYLHKTFDLGGKAIARARLYVSAKGLYEFYIDGKKVGNAEVAPGWTDYRKRVLYDSFDVTEQLKSGANEAGMVIGNGWYCGHIGLTGGDNYGDYPEGLAEIVVDFKDGSQTIVGTDDTWRGKTGPILSDDLLMGETYDSRKEMPGWNKVGFNDFGWDSVTAKPIGDIPVVANQGPLVDRLQTITPIGTIPQKKAGVYVFDMGQNMVGRISIRATGPAGTTIGLRYAEMLNPDKSVYTANLRGAKATDAWTLKGGEESFEPMFTTHGFRYVEVTGYPGVPTAQDIKGIVVGSDNPQTGWFQCSNPLVNQLWHNIYWGERGNYLSIPTDCPQRDERLGWMGDAQIFVRTATYNNDIAGFMTKWTQDVVDAQSAAGGFSDVSPRMGDQSDGAPAWGDAGVIVPFTIYKAYGDLELLKQRYPAMRHWIEYIDSANPDHIWINRSNNNFGDWLNVHDDTPRPVIATAYFAYSTQLVEESAKALGYQQDADELAQLHGAIVDAFDQKFVDADGKIEGDTQTDYVLALRFGLLPDSQRAQAADRLVKHIMVDRKGHLSTGFVGVGYLNPVLTAMGHTDVAYHLLTQDTYPSWGYSIRQGATTIWERWDGWTKTNGFQDPGMNSFNHYSLGSVGEWMYGTAAGIDTDPETPGFKHVVIRPIPGPGITWAKATYDSMHGKISTSWSVSNGRFTLDVTIPANVQAKIILPTTNMDQVMESGKPARIAPGVSTYNDAKTSNVLLVGGGTYHFSCPISS